MSSSGICVTALGMVSALGRDVVTSCAAARAGLSMSAELTSMEFSQDELFGHETLDGFPTVFGHSVRGAGDGFKGVGKAVVQGSLALDDLLKHRPLDAREQSRTGLIVNVSDYFMEDAAALGLGSNESPSVRWKSSTESLPLRLAESRGLALSQSNYAIHRGGHAGGAASLADGIDRIKRGSVDRCIVGGIDARTDPAFLKAAAQLFQLRTVDNPVGLCPGEAAAFYLLERTSDATRFKPIAEVGGAWSERDATHLLDEAVAPSGAGLSAAVSAGLRDLGTTAASSSQPWLLGDHNGTSRRATEWSHALVRMLATEGFAPEDVWFPAISFGDVGAAAAAVAICCVGRAFARNYAKRETALIWLSSESGAKGSITLVRARNR